ncbi:replication initiation protein [Streptococcus macedonicus]|uniref:Replication initiation protein n=1 Tax=Streptococcus macedonicus TaxID=59310 RepID=A0AAP8FZQ1_STRMC|nr:replication initiator protein A [Streptococcus macedonicus]PHV58717.1 replication initiation protein [Streptococcus macedonicus]
MSGLEQFSAITLEQMQTSERFFPMAWVLWEDTHYQKLKSDCKVLYSMMKNRLELSAKNGWVDELGRVYIEFSNAEIQRYFNCSKPTAIKLKKDLSDYGLIYEYSQFSNADGQLANRIYIGQVMTYDAEKYKQERLERQEKAFQKRIEKRQNRPRKNNLRGVSKDLTGAVNNFDPNYKDSSKTDSSKDNYSPRKAEQNSDEFSQPAKADHHSSQNQSLKYVPPKYYSLLNVIADRYNAKFTQYDLFTGEFQNYSLTHQQKMLIGQYLAEGYVTSQEIIDLIENHVPVDCESPLAYLLKSLENLKRERLYEQKEIAHRNAENYYAMRQQGVVANE